MISAAANSVLFAKECSPQTVVKKNWIPYRLIGKGNQDGCLSTMPFKVNDAPFTVLARTNMELLEYAMGTMQSASATTPKFSLNGDGASSGRQKWIKMLKLIDNFYNIYTGEQNNAPALNDWSHLRGEKMSWGELCDDIEMRELAKYAAVVAFIEKFDKRTHEVIEAFREEILDKKYSAEDADIILSTIHCAKGMEWDRVQVLDDALISLSKYKFDHGGAFSSGNFRQASCGVKLRALFDYTSWGDELHLWYVALTRAKLTLCIPQKFLIFLETLGPLNVHWKVVISKM